MSAPVLQLRVPETTLARLDDTRGEDTRSAWVLRLIDRELDGQATTAEPQTRQALTDSTAQAGTPRADSEATAGPLALPAGEPCPGVACSGPGCRNRDTARYGLRHLVLCTASSIARLLGVSRATIYKYVPEVTTGRVAREHGRFGLGLVLGGG